MKVAVEVANVGNVSIAERVNLQLWAMDGDADRQLAELVNQPLKLAAGKSRVFKFATTVPGDLAAGTYSLEVRVDTNDVVAESDEGNNTASEPVALIVENADLSLTFASSTLPRTVVPGDRGVVRVALANEADVKAKGRIDLQLWAACDDVVFITSAYISTTNWAL